MSILVVGSIAIDSVETPHGKEASSYGGSALFFSAAASHFSPVNVVGVVGTDFDMGQIEFLKARGVDLRGIQVEEGKTFRWGGKYHENMNLRDTLFTHLNVFENFRPVIPPAYRHSELIFLANIHPELQMDVLNQIHKPKLAVLDTMNFWISGTPEALMAVIRRCDIIILNDEELSELTGSGNLFTGARLLLKEGPKALVIKKGEHGSVLLTESHCFLAPAFPLETVIDPTGAGDSFAGGFLGYLATCETYDEHAFRRAVVYGNVVASFTVEGFSFDKQKDLTPALVHKRVENLKEMTRF